MSDYAEFLANRKPRARQVGPECSPADVNPMLHPWQAELVAWLVRTSRVALWADTGLGKTLMQIEWARLVAPGGTILVIAPLAVCHQTVREAERVDVAAAYVRSPDHITGPGVWVTNYEMLDHFDPTTFDAVVLDEASILKQSDGKTRATLIEWAAPIRHRLACTATPAPNDPEELTGQAEFLGRMRRADMLAAYFVHDQDGWRLKGHARTPMLTWMATWAVALRKPSDVGYPDGDYNLPGLNIETHLLPVNTAPEGELFAATLGGVQGRAQVRRETLRARCERAAELVNAEPDEPWLLWAGLNDEAALLAELTGAVNVHGGLDPDTKADLLLSFADGSIPRLVTKPAIASLGLNLQRCARMVFVGLSDSYESYYQAIRRCYRYGQTRVVDAHVVLSDVEAHIAANVARKERAASDLTADLVQHITTARKAVA